MKELFISLFIIISGIFLMTSCCRMCADHVTGNSEKIGTIVHFGQHGIFFKTYEAEMIKGGMNGGTGGFGTQPFWFTVRNTALVDDIQKAFDGQKEIKIKYHTEMFCLFDSDSGCDYLDAVVR